MLAKTPTINPAFPVRQTFSAKARLFYRQQKTRRSGFLLTVLDIRIKLPSWLGHHP